MIKIISKAYNKNNERRLGVCVFEHVGSTNLKMSRNDKQKTIKNSKSKDLIIKLCVIVEK